MTTPKVQAEVDIEELTRLAKAATPAPWAYTENCGAQVCVGLVHDQEPGMVRLQKGGFFLFEIEADAYDRDGEADQDECEEKAYADAKLIACMRNSFEALLQELTELRAMRLAVHELSECAIGRNQLAPALEFDLHKIEELTR